MSDRETDDSSSASELDSFTDDDFDSDLDGQCDVTCDAVNVHSKKSDEFQNEDDVSDIACVRLEKN